MTSILKILQITEKDLSLEENRRKTLEYWPIDFIDRDSMAASGFYYDGLSKNDSVRCFSCKISLIEWKKDDDPYMSHKQWSRTCKYLVENEKISKYPLYKLEGDRLTSFENWPENAHAQPELLSDAGFYYSGVRDICLCYHCGIKLENWKISDSPWEKHIKLRPNCEHIVLTKGNKFINITQKKLGILSSKKKQEEEVLNSLIKLVVQNSDEDRYLCAICMDNQREVGLIPCGHTFCVNCSKNIKICPSCRKVVKDTLRLYF